MVINPILKGSEVSKKSNVLKLRSQRFVLVRALVEWLSQASFYLVSEKACLARLTSFNVSLLSLMTSYRTNRVRDGGSCNWIGKAAISLP